MKSTKIKSIKSLGEQVVYDLTVADDHTYITAGGIINHNTTCSDIKTMFIPPKGYLLLQLDYSQAELRVMAAQAGEKTMIKWFKEGKDIHIMSALKKYHMEDEYERIKKLLDDEDDNDEE